MMFPDYLDGAKVIEYTQRGSFAFTADPWNDEKPGMVKKKKPKSGSTELVHLNSRREAEQLCSEFTLKFLSC